MPAALALLIAVSLTALAQAQTPTVPTVPEDTCSAANDALSQEACDTEVTPVPKKTDDFAPIAGAKFDQVDVNGDPAMHSSVADFTVDFFGDDFFGSGREGFFVGAQCINTDTAFPDTDPDCGGNYVDEPERAPAIYHYTTRPDGVFEIHQTYGPEVGNTDPGYVAAVAWIGPGKAIAVGGTGHYPRRELSRGPQETDEQYIARDLAGEEENAAGEARVWLYRNGLWSERELPGLKDGNLADCDPDSDPECTPMGGLTTVDCSPRRTVDGELCLAGGLRQLWKWQGDQFTEAFTPTSTDDVDKLTVDDGAGWRFRVRQVRFVAGNLPFNGAVAAVAVTSGCCAQTRNQDAARVLFFAGDTWRSRLLINDELFTGGPGVTPGNGLDQVPTSEQRAAIRSALPSQTIPESFYAVGTASVSPSIVIASGRPVPAAGISEPEPRSAVINGLPTVNSVSTGSARLVAADGDFCCNLGPNPDGTVDWAVGVLRSNGQGLAYTTTTAGVNNAAHVPSPLTCSVVTFPPPQPTDCQANDAQQMLDTTKSGSLVTVETYALNGFAFTPSGGTGWAVGDKGAIACLNCEGSVGSGAEEPDPDPVGAKTVASVSGSSAYQGLNPGGGAEGGAVPSLATQPTVKLPEPRLIPAGSPNPRSSNAEEYRVNAIVMSRDGSEGWAVAGDSNAGGRTVREDILFHFDGARWTVCDPVGIPDQVDPDPACAGLAPLMKNQPPVQLRAAARVPLENDSDPTNDDEFEVVALGSRYQPASSPGPRSTVLRYRDGRWSVDEQAMRELSPVPASEGSEFHAIVFTAPDDGWALGSNANALGLQLARYDGTRWVICNTQPAACGNSTDAILPLGKRSAYFLASAGPRVYLGGTRFPNEAAGAHGHPFIASIDTGADNPTWEREYDPGCVEMQNDTCVADQDDPDSSGSLAALSITQGPDGGYVGTAAGLFGTGTVPDSNLVGEGDAIRTAGGGARAALLRMDTGGGDCGRWRWCLWQDGGAADDYLSEDETSCARGPGTCSPSKLLELRSASGGVQTFLTSRHENKQGVHPMLYSDEDRCPAGEQGSNCWKVLPAPFTSSRKLLDGGWGSVVASAHAMAPDGQGGFWLATRQGLNISPEPKDIFFYHYTDRMPLPVFEDAPHPIREEITDAAPGPSGQLWVTTRSGFVYRYDRILGWDRLPVPGWDRGNVITRASAANAVAVADDGTGVVVGEGGRLADISPGGVRLNGAAGIGCGADSVAACTSGFDLTSAAISPDGSVALAGGEGRALLCRDQGGQFHAVSPPNEAATNATFTGISMPSASEAYLTTDTGQVFIGHGSCGGWSWTLEDLNEDGQLVTLNAAELGMRLNAVSVDSSGHGYAVGERGLVLERRPGAAETWRRLSSGVRDDLYSVALPEGSGSGVLIGGQLGLVLTLRDGRFEVARTDDVTDPVTAGVPSANTGRIVGLGLSSGSSDGQVEAWAVSQVPLVGNQSRDPVPGAVLHYTNATDDPLLDGGMHRASPVSDTPSHSDDELTVAAFGRSDCVADDGTCREFQSTSMFNQEVATRAAEEILAKSDEPGGPDLALFTGDVNHVAGRDSDGSTPLDVDVMHRRWVEEIASRFDDSEHGLPLYGAIGVQDLSSVQSCDRGTCTGTRSAGVGTSGPWQQSFAGRWPGGEKTHGDLTFQPLTGAQLESPAGGGALTHYAVDIKRGGAPIARLIVIDNSFRSLAGSDPQQNPVEEQQTWLRQTLCKRGSAADTPQTPCSREPDQRAIVLMNTPTYSYNTTASGGAVETATDQVALESILLTNEADAVISGRLGWNGLFYTTVPGLHYPCPGGDHPAPDGTDAPAPGAAPPCDQAGAGDDQPELPPLPTEGGAGALPTLVASGAGGTFGPPSSPVTGAASAGFWHGYSLLHMNLATGAVRVEERPIFDWLGIRSDPRKAQAIRSLRANKKLQLEGFGREAAAADLPLRYDEITTNAITHVYSLLAADPDKPWLAATDESPPAGLSADGPKPENCGPYICLARNIGWIDPTSGEVTSGNGAYPRTYAIAQLSVGAQAATYPMVFEPRGGFNPPVPPPPRPATPVPPPPPPAQPPQPQQPSVDPIVPPALPIAAAATPPPPPAPPAPPTFASQAPLDVNIAPTALDVQPPTAVTQPPTPPVNPAPPGGARKEARQRQAAAQKSGADNAEEGEGSDGVDPSDAQNRVNPVDSEHQAATRIEPGRETHPFTAISHTEQPSAWSRGLLYGGGLTLAALILAFGLNIARPTPRRREPEVPAPAFAKERRER